MNKYIVIVLLSFVSFGLVAEESYCFRVYLKGKGESEYSQNKPEDYLSRRAIERRVRQGKPISASDLPICGSYLDSLSACGGNLVVSSKWFSTVVVASPDSLLAERLMQLSFVDSVKWVWKGDRDGKNLLVADSTRLFPADKLQKSYYGYAEDQIKMLNGVKLHEAGYTGKGMHIAVIDAGFMHVDRIGAFDSLDVLGTKNFVFPGASVYADDDHGTKVLSCLAANKPGLIVGTAPEASYWLIKSEDNRSEYPIEEDYWVAAVEFADSAGVDVVSSSLGYFTFDVGEMKYNQSALDGKTAFISKAAHKAAEKGILVFCSAGNEGNGSWEKITFPSDASDVVTVGAITEKRRKSIFSSVGLTADYRVKPDVVALGSGCCVIDSDGRIHYANGTSFSTPILAGLGTCLWQALPEMGNKEIIRLLQRSASQYKQPDAELGYGIPDLFKAYKNKDKYIEGFK